MTNQQLDEWLDSEYLLVKDVQNEDIIVVHEVLGLVDSFGKKKFQIVVYHNGKNKFLNLNKVQYRQMEPISTGARFAITKIEINGGIALNFRRL